MTGRKEPIRGRDNPAAAATRLSLLWALPEHAGEISRLHALAFPSAWDEAAIARLLGHPGSIALVGTHGNPPSLVGFALAQVAADEAEILTLAVRDDWRRQGLGLRLVEGIKRAAARSGARSLYLEVGDRNAAAQQLYRRSGFAETGRRKGYYAHAGSAPEDAVVLRCELAAS